MLRSLEQSRAKFAWECVQEIKKLNDEKIEKNYNSYVKRSLALIQTNGLGNTLAFYRSKKEQAYSKLNEHINNWFNNQIISSQDILKWIISEKTDSIEIFYATKEILALLSWVKRFAESELKGE